MDDDQERRRAAVDAVLKFLLVATVLCAVLGLGTYLAAKVIGVGGDTTSGTRNPGDTSAPSDLPTVALTPDRPSATPTETAPAPPSVTPQTGIVLTASPATAGSFERVNLTGTYPGQDNVSLQVQRKDGGTWAPFADVRADVSVGTFATYVKTSRPGENRFRVYDATTGTASNVVTVTIG